MGLGLRAQVAANLAAAVSVSFGLMALTTMGLVRGELQAAGEGRADAVADLLAAQVAACPDEACAAAALDGLARLSGGAATLGDGPCCAATRLRREQDGAAPVHLVERRAGARVLTLRLPAGGLVAQVREAQLRLVLLLVGEALLVVLLGLLLFERAFVRRIAGLDQALGRAERLDLDSPFLVAESGDELGRMGGTVRRMVDKIREDKRRREAYIAELEAANRELVRTREGLVRSEKLATVGRLAAGVAHEIGNPVAAILGYVGIMRRRAGGAGDEYPERIEREVQRVDRILRDLLEFARPQPAALGPLSLAQVVEAAARLVEPQPRWRAMALVVDLPAGLPAVLAQEHYATQVLVNLLINAADACGGQGTVRVGAQVTADAVELRVEDDGPGLAPEDLPRLFDPFFTTKAPGEGTGLGLAVCHRLMESFGGSIRAQNGAPKGASFVLHWRRAEVARAEIAGGA